MNNKFDELVKGVAQSVTRRAALEKFSLGLAGLTLACFGLAGGAEANPTLTSIDFPGAVSTRATGINLAGDIVGIYADKLAGKDHGFLLRGGVITTIDVPGAAITEPWKINNSGEIAGRYADTTDDKSHIFKLSNGVFVFVGDFPGAVQTAPAGLSVHHGGLNGPGDIVSVYTTASPVYNVSNDNVLSNAHGFLLSGGVYTSIEFPGAIGTVSYGINDSGFIVGGYEDANEQAHAYLRTP